MLDWLNHRAGWSFIAGSVVVMILNYRRWQSDLHRLGKHLTTPSNALSYDGELPQVSLLVAAWNEAHIINDHIASFRHLSYPNKQMVLIAGGNDHTYELASKIVRDQSDGNIIVLEQKAGEGKQRALRRGYEHATGDIIFLTDADSYLTDDAFMATIAPILEGKAQVTTGNIRPLERQCGDPFVLHRWFNEVFVSTTYGTEANGLLGANSAIARTALDTAGGFDADVASGTDYHLAKTLLAQGIRLHYVRESIIETEYAESWRVYARQQMRWLRNVVTHGLSFGRRDEAMRAFIPSVIGAVMLLTPIIALLTGPILLALWSVIVLHVLLSRIRYMRFGELTTGYSFRSGYFRLPYYILLDFVIWAMTALDYPLGRTRW